MQYLNRRIHWKAVSGRDCSYRSSCDGTELCLKVNPTFPDASFYTLKVAGETLDLDEAPPGWTFDKREVDPPIQDDPK